jgi:FkbM family methyltransferase
VSKVKIVIGSHTDLEFLEDSIQDESLLVYAFEPNQSLIRKCYLKHIIPSNYKIIEKAVSDKSEVRTFYLCSDSLCSSLNKFTKEIEWGDIKEVMVETIRMDEFIKDNNIQEIDYLHIDAQGSDFDVLCGFGDKISIVKEGVCESMAPNIDWTLYENQAKFEDFKKFFLDNKFDISWKPNLGSGLGEKEVNIYFKRSKDLNNPKVIQNIM